MFKILCGTCLCLLLMSTGAIAQSCTSLPYTLTNGTTANATQVMSNLNCVFDSPVFAGPVGIGGTPGYPLEIDNATNATVSINSLGQRQWWIGAIKAGTDANFVIGTGPSYANSDFTIIPSNGYVGINQMHPSYPLDVVGPAGASGAVDIEGSSSTLFSNYWSPNTGSTITASAGGGSCTYSGGSGWSCSSDERLKSNIENLRPENGITAINRLRPVSYRLDGNGDMEPQLGFLAQELRQVFPQAVTLDDSVTSPATPHGSYLVNYTALIPPTVLAVQQLDARTESQEAKLKMLVAVDSQQGAELRALRKELDTLERRTNPNTARN